MAAHDLHTVQQPGRSVQHVLQPRTLLGALVALRDNPTARAVAGGTDLLLELQRGGPGPGVTLVDLSRIDHFAAIEVAELAVLGAGVTHNQVIGSADLVTAALPLAQACLEVGSPQLRNRATIVGNLVTASPANDTISALLALDADIGIAGLQPDGSPVVRDVALAEFFTGFRTTILTPGELVYRVRIPRLHDRRRGLWVKSGLRRAQAISVVHAGFVVETDDDGTVTGARIALGSVAPTVVLVAEAADSLVGSPLTDATIDMAVDAAVASVSPIDDGRATAAYRNDTIAVIVRRALHALASAEEAGAWPSSPPRLDPTSPHKPSLTPVPDIADGDHHHDFIDDETTVSVRLNDRALAAGGAASRTLLDWIRDEAGAVSPLSGVKEGCAEGECGACTVILEGKAVMSCLVPAAQADGADITTVEGIAAGPVGAAVQQGFVDEFAVQCGFCIPGFVVAAERLLTETRQPTDEQIRLGLSGNLCRCTGYYAIVEAVHAASRTLSTEGDRS